MGITALARTTLVGAIAAITACGATPSRVCSGGRQVLLGACVGPATSASYCSTLPIRSAAPGDERGCPSLVPCPPGSARDLEDGSCWASPHLRDVLGAMGKRLAEDEVASCADPRATLAGAGSLVVCVPPACSDRPCHPPACPLQTIFDPDTRACARVVTSGPREPAVDLARWARVVLGHDGGAGSSHLCAALATVPAALARVSRSGTGMGGMGAGARVEALIQLHVPDNRLADVRFEAAADRAPDTPMWTRAVTPLVDALRDLGDIATLTELSVRVSCTVRASPPVVVPLADEADDQR